MRRWYIASKLVQKVNMRVYESEKREEKFDKGNCCNM